MTIRSIHDPKYWHDRAAGMRVLSDEFADNETKSIMVRLANDHDELGDRVKERAAKLPGLAISG